MTSDNYANSMLRERILNKHSRSIITILILTLANNLKSIHVTCNSQIAVTPKILITLTDLKGKNGNSMVSVVETNLSVNS